jgi:predicted transcriptional regulator
MTTLKPRKLIRSIRIDDELWKRAAVQANAESTTISGIVIRALLDYLKRNAGKE